MQNQLDKIKAELERVAKVALDNMEPYKVEQHHPNFQYWLGQYHLAMSLLSSITVSEKERPTK